MKRLVLALAVALPLLAQQVAPPPPSAPRDPRLPQSVETTLDNGLRVIVVPKHDIPLVAARLMVKAGGAADPSDKAGLAELTAKVLTQGTKKRSAEQIARDVEALGATLSAAARWDSSVIDLSVLSSNLGKAMESVADVARNATFARDEVERERDQTIDALQVDLSQPRSIADAVTYRLIYGGGAYGSPLSGTPESVRRLRREDLVRFHRLNYLPERSVLVLAGDIQAEEAYALARKVFGSWARGTAAKSAAVEVPKPATARVVVVDMPDAGQASVTVGRQGIRRVDPSYMPALVANSVLGGNYSSRLNQEIRIRRGLSYGSYSSLEARAGNGSFTERTDTKNESATEVATLLVAEMNRLATSDVPESELTPRKAALIGEFAQNLETTSGIVEAVSALALHDLPLSDIHGHIRNVQAVTAEQVRTFAGANLGGMANVVVVGDAKQFLESLRKEFPEVDVLTVQELDLNSPTLRVRKKKG